MPLMKSLRDFRLATTSGHVIEILANEPKFIPEVAVSEAMKHGCVPVDPKDIPFFDDQTRAKVEFTSDIRASLLYSTIDEIVKENKPAYFTGGGVPKAEEVSKRLGFDVQQKEVTDAYQNYTAFKSENRPFPLHPNTDNVLLVIQAKTRAELQGYAVELCGYTPENVAGLKERDLRKQLLVKLTGSALE